MSKNPLDNIHFASVIYSYGKLSEDHEMNPGV